MRLGRVSFVLMVFALALAAPASANELLSSELSAARAVDRSCTERSLSGGEGYEHKAFNAPAAGTVTAQLEAAEGDWDLAVLDSKGDVVAGSAHRGGREVASGLALKGEQLTLQACRLSGSSDTAKVTATLAPIDTSAAERASLVHVSTPTRERRQELANLGLDVTEHGGDGFVAVVLYGAADARKLASNNFVYTTEVADLSMQARRDRAADARFAAANERSELPSGGTTYRRLFDYSEDLKRLAREHPDLVRPITLNHRTYEGRPVEGIEIASNPGARDGRPVFLNMGIHHAREWPSGEHAMEWAYELILGARKGDARVKGLLDSTRTIVVPVINPDGFNASREAGQLYLNGDGAHTDLDGSGDISDPEFILAAASHPNEYRRKNCRLVTDSDAGSCQQQATGIVEAGVDPNRNYGAFWGGPGASDNPLIQTYRGPGPFSEPETKNVRELISGRQVTTLITNHTFSNLVLRPPSLAAQGETPDEPAYKALGDSMAAENGYASQFSHQLYDTSGGLEDWSYYSTGGLGYTFEIGELGFHPPFEETVKHYNGENKDAPAGAGGNREAFFKAHENAADAAGHSVLAGRAPAGAVLRVRKQFETPTAQKNADGSTRTFTDVLDTNMQVGPDGRFTWHVNPSTRPLVIKSSGREPTGEPSAEQRFESRGGTVPCAEFDNPPPGCYEDHKITVPSGAGIDNAVAKIRTEFSPESDWDMKVYRADSSGNATGDPLASSGNGATSGALGYEEAALTDPSGDYVVRMINYAAVSSWTGTVTFAGPDSAAASEETWTLFCEQPEGVVRSARQVFVGRGERRALDLRADCRTRR